MEEVDEVADVASDYFIISCDRMEECLNTIIHKITDDMLEVLTRLYSSEEVKAALF